MLLLFPLQYHRQSKLCGLCCPEARHLTRLTWHQFEGSLCRDIQRRLPPDPLLTSTSGAPSYISPSKALQPHSLQQGMQRQEQPQRKGRYDPQEAAHSETAYLSAEEDAAFEQTPFPSPGAPSPHHSAHRILLPVVHRCYLTPAADWRKQAPYIDSPLRRSWRSKLLPFPMLWLHHSTECMLP